MKNKIKVAVLDTGIDKNHDFLRESIVGGISFKTKNGYIMITEDYEDKNGHGTSCSSIIKREFNNVELFIVKVLDDFGNSNIQVLEEGLKFVLNTDVKIVNLSLSVLGNKSIEDLYSICERLKQKGKIIVCSVENGFESSYPAQFDNVIGVRGFVLERESAIWYNKDYRIQCVMDNNSYLCCDLNNSYKLFGKSNSQSAAKLTGKIAEILYRFPNINLEDLSEKLEKLSMRNHWTEKDLERSKRFPEIQQYDKSINYKLVKDLINILKNELNITESIDDVHDIILFNDYVGLNDNNCFNILKKIENNFNLKFDYMSISRYDLISIYSLMHLVTKYM
ncbi:TPA: S8 family serine peptidase [Clostridioides difficile]|nr:S8 family serine peptidase [Clostridioides difficile]HBF4061950.1 S8 family serine peptidase [Clostridioides difficile]HBF6021735.1 S8 family serine peptidase [Clostridioides difficile]HBF7091689.1 S8 family serine peptidase [Clostridioides difficile]HEK8843452.1 S8 family serine peptidase [Clostridioides difficile]